MKVEFKTEKDLVTEYCPLCKGKRLLDPLVQTKEYIIYGCLATGHTFKKEVGNERTG